jgi:hypothetical protein
MKSTLSIYVNEKNFNEIKSGNKPYEYILVNKYWKKRIENKKYSSLIITLGHAEKQTLIL